MTGRSNKFKCILKSVSNMFCPTICSTFPSTKQRTRLIKKEGTDLLLCSATFETTCINETTTYFNFLKGVSKTRHPIFLGCKEAYIIAREAPILRPHNDIFFIRNRSFIQSTTAFMSRASFYPYVRYCPSLFPHPLKSKAIKLTWGEISCTASILCPPLPWRQSMVGRVQKLFGNIMHDSLYYSELVTAKSSQYGGLLLNLRQTWLMLQYAAIFR